MSVQSTDGTIRDFELARTACFIGKSGYLQLQSINIPTPLPKESYMHDIQLKLAFIGFAGIAAQWIAWRMRLPAIALLLLAGLVAGPVTGFIDPAADFGETYRAVVALAVAIILFEGGLTLNFSEIHDSTRAIRRIILIGGPLAWGLGTLAGHYAGGLTWQTAIILGAILVVTGPTVIMPLLRQARLKSRPASLLRWEAIINDPIGALFAVLSFETILVLNNVHEAENLMQNAIIALLLAGPGAWALSKGIVWLFIRAHVPEFLKAPVLVALAIAANSITNLFLEEAGLLTVTVMGITIANARLASLSEMRRFKETITVILVSAVFILLTASLNMQTIRSLGLDVIWFVLAILFVVRPVAIMIATIGTGITLQERILSAWIAPRGIVAVAVAGLFGTTLVEQGVPDGDKMIAYTFAVVAATIILHGFSLPALARILGLRSSEKPGILFVGGSKWTVAFAEKMRALDVPVLIVDDNWNHLANARSGGVPTFYGNILSEHAHHEINMNVWGSVIAATDNDAFNALVCNELGPEIGRSHVFQIGNRDKQSSSKRSLHFTRGGRPLMKPGMEFAELRQKIEQGWAFSSSRLTAEFTFEDYRKTKPDHTHLLFWFRPGGDYNFASINPDIIPGEGNIVVSFGPTPQKQADENPSEEPEIPESAKP